MKTSSNIRAVAIPINELSQSMQHTWSNIQLSNPGLLGPCFSPELFITVGKFCSNIFVALLYKGGNLAGFLPFLKDQRSMVAKPVPLCDYQFIVSPKSQRWDIKEILEQLGLNA